jgi:MoaA/NifB/PqqE/SkfB family radical SAM enzyme
VKEIFSLKKLLNLKKGRAPKQLIIQTTNFCNARCPQCGMRITESYTRSKLSVDVLKRIIDAAAEEGISIISFTGGEPFIFLDDLITVIDYASQAGIQYTRTGTNGFMLRYDNEKDHDRRVNGIAERLAKTNLRNIWISVDSFVPSIHEKMRGFDGLVRGIEKALPIFRQHNIFPAANLGINRNLGGYLTALLTRDNFRDEYIYGPLFYIHYKEAFRKFFTYAIDMGFTIVGTCYPMSVDEADNSSGLTPVYAATSADYVVRFTKKEKSYLFKALMEIIPEFRHKTRIFSPLSSLYALYMQHSGNDSFPYPCFGGIDYFFIDSKNGDTYPCGYRGADNLGKFWDKKWLNGNHSVSCHKCDWECFRDPSEMLGPLLHFFKGPSSLIRRFRDNREYMKMWLDDIRYYFACSFFDGRKPPNYSKLKKFAARHKIPYTPLRDESGTLANLLDTV